MNNAQQIIQAARIAKSKGLAIAAMSGGYCAVNRVTYMADGKSHVETKAAWLTGAEAISYLKGYTL